MIRKFTQSLLFLFGALCTLCNAHAGDIKGPLRIGAILILSGEGASWGTASRNGIELAVEELNSGGGVLGRKLEVVFQDDQGDPKKTISSFRHLTEVESIHLIIGPTWSNLGIPLIEMATRKKVVMLSPSLGMPKFNESSPFLFNTWPHDYILSEKLAEYVIKEGHRSIALVGAEDVWVKEQTNAFKARYELLGGQIAYIAEPLRGTTDLRTEALRIKNTPNIDAFVSTTDGAIVGSLVAKSLKDLNVSLPKYSITLDQTAIDAAQGGFEGLKFLTFLTPIPDFQRKYESRFHTPIDIGADSSYDAVMMLTKAIESAQSVKSDDVAKALSEIKTYSGVSGRLISDGKRGFVKDYAVKQIVNGKPQDLN